MYPSGSFPREQQASIGPQQLPFGHHRIKHAAASCRRAPYFMTGAGSYVRDADGPRFGRDPWAECEKIMRRGNADERDLARIGRPNRLGVLVDAWIDIPQALGCWVEDADEGVISTAADKGEFQAIGRPPQRLRGSASVHGLRSFVMTIKRRPPDLSLAEKRDAVALGRNCGVVSFAEFARLTAVERNGP